MEASSLPTSWEDGDVAVCPDHLRFVPCRRCEPGEGVVSTDPADVQRTRDYQLG